MGWEDRSGGSQTGFDRDAFKDVEIGTWRYPLSSISVEVLALRFGRSAVSGSCGVRLRSPRSTKTGCYVERQRANGNDDQHTLPPALNNASMSQQTHVAISGRPRCVGLYNIGQKKPRDHYSNSSPMNLDTELRAWFLHPNQCCQQAQKVH